MIRYICCLLFLLSVCLTNAQNITFRINTDSIFLPNGDLVNLDNYDTPPLNLTVYGGTVSSQASLSDFVDSLSFDDPQSLLAELNNLGSDPIFTSDGLSLIQPTTGSGPIGGSFDWSTRVDDLTVGHFPVLIVATNSLGNLTLADSFGMVSTNLDVPSIGTDTVGFSGTNGIWNQFYIGSGSSLTLAPIPEPETYAMIFGLGVLALVVYRRVRRS